MCSIHCSLPTHFLLHFFSRQEESIEASQIDAQENLQISLRDEVRRLNPIKLAHKPKSLHLVLGNDGELRVVATLANNTVELYTISTTNKGSDANCLRSIVQQGHHSEVRAVSFSSDNLAIVSGSAESIKLWNRPSQTCLRTIETGLVSLLKLRLSNVLLQHVCSKTSADKLSFIRQLLKAIVNWGYFQRCTLRCTCAHHHKYLC